MQKQKQKVHWLVEDFERDNSFGELADEIRRQGHPCEVIRYVPFSSGDYSQIWPEETCVVFQGSIQLARQIQRERGSWVPGPIADWRNYLCRIYYAYLGRFLLNEDYSMLPFGHLLYRKESLFERHGGSFFIRPDDGAKSFTGTLVTPDSLTGNSLKSFEYDTSPESLVVVAPNRLIKREWRLVCIGDEVITGSRYKTFGQCDFRPDVPTEVIEYGEGILKAVSWRPDPVFILDICETSSLHLLEIGAFSVAGLYKCDLEKIVSRVSEVSLALWADMQPGEGECP